MKKIIVGLILVFYAFSSFSQDANFNHKKYWYLRWRLKHYFMVMGDGPGMSLPFEIRNKWNGDDLDMGDVPNNLGPYIGVLATEYKLLSDNNQNTSETLEELYYAIKAIERLDNCEGQFPWTVPNNLPPLNQLDGLCSRNDASWNFIRMHQAQLNKSLSSFADSSEGNPKALTHYDSADDPANYESIPNFMSDAKAGALMSQDHISSIFVGLALVKKFIPDGLVFNGMDLKSESQSITHRIVQYMQGSGLTGWHLKNPEGNNVPSGYGGDAGWLSWGFSKAAAFIDPAHSTEYLTNSGAMADHVIWEEIGSLALDPGDICTDFGNIVDAQTCENPRNSWITLNLACVGNSWESSALSASYFFPWMAPVTLACYIPGVDCTQGIIWARSYPWDWTAYYPLLHAVLYDGGCMTAQSTIEDNLNTMPCSGPYNLYPYGQAGGGWASPRRYHDPPFENTYGEGYGTSNGVRSGKFSGIEYMLLFNLYCIHQNGAYISNYYNMMNNTNLSNAYPNVAALNIGSNVNPLNAWEFSTLTSDSKINAPNPSNPSDPDNGNVVFRAGEKIVLNAGFEVHNGARFEAVVDPYECNSSGTVYLRVAASVTIGDSVPGSPKQNNSAKKSLSEKANGGNSFAIIPNPSVDKIKLSFTITQPAPAKIKILNTIGQTMAVIENNEVKEAGTYQTEFDIHSFSPGIYFCTIESGEYRETKKLVKVNNQ